MANSKEGYEALNATVRGIVERAIASLQAIGMTNEGALQLLAIQATIRMDDVAAVRCLLKSIEDGLPVEGDDDDDHTTGGLS
jgi:hypothetical protein